MTARLTFIAITVFWLAMNGLLWRAEFGSRGGDTAVPVALVWRKILTAPDASSLSVYQQGNRMGYCEFSTSIGQQMAAVDADKLPPEGLVKQAGYQIHLSGNVSLGDFTNRLKFDGLAQFSTPGKWHELTIHITTRLAVVEIHSVATNQTVHFRISNDGLDLVRDLTFKELQDPTVILRAFLGDFTDLFISGYDLPDQVAIAGPRNLEWTACRTRLKIGTESVPVYQVETIVLGHKIKIVISTLGEVLRVELPGDIVACIDQ